MKERLQAAEASQISNLTDAAKEMENVAQKAENGTENDVDKKTDGKEKTTEPELKVKTGFEAVSDQNDIGTSNMAGLGAAISVDVQV